MIREIENTLKTVGPPVFHFKAHKQKGSYIVFAEDGQQALTGGDNRAHTQVIEGTIDYFTREEYDENVGKIQTALNGVCAWSLNSIQYEDDTDYIHYEWTFRVVMAVGQDGV